MTSALRPRSFSPFLKRRSLLALAFNAFFFAFILWWLYSNLRYADFAMQMQRIPPSAILTAMAMNLAVLALYGLRVATILRAKPMACFLIANIGFTFNALIPFRLGEGVKIYFGASHFKIPIGSLGAAIVMEKIYDLSAILVLAALIGASSDSKVIALGRPTLMALALVVTVCAALIALLRARGAPPSLPDWAIVRRLRLDVFLRQAETLLMDHNVPAAVFFTTAIWTINASLVFFLFSALLSDTQFAPLGAISLVVIGALAIAVPASPAGLGFFEAGIVSYLVAMHGVPKEQAISAALAYHFCITAPHTVNAILFLAFVSLRSLKAKMAP